MHPKCFIPGEKYENKANQYASALSKKAKSQIKLFLTLVQYLILQVLIGRFT